VRINTLLLKRQHNSRKSSETKKSSIGSEPSERKWFIHKNSGKVSNRDMNKLPSSTDSSNNLKEEMILPCIIYGITAIHMLLPT
jgi:hypothetical protein